MSLEQDRLGYPKIRPKFTWLRSFATLQETERDHIPRSSQFLGPASGV